MLILPPYLRGGVAVGGSSGFSPQSGYSLSGTIGHGNSVTLTKSGGGFGTGPSLILDDRVSNIAAYSGFTEGTQIPFGGAYVYADGVASDLVLYSEENLRHSNQTANYKISSEGAGGTSGTVGWPNLFGGLNPPDGQDKIFCRCWIRRNTTGTGGTSESSKVFRVWDLSSGTGTRVSMGRLAGDGLTVNNTNPGTAVGVGGFNMLSVGQWSLCECFVSLTQAIGWQDNNVKGPYNGAVKDQGSSSLAKGYNMALCGWDGGGGDFTHAEWQLSDIYVANSLARVTVSDNSDWASVTNVQEIQLVTSWSDTSITFDMLFGQFGSSVSGKHVHVHPEDGSHLYAGSFA